MLSRLRGPQCSPAKSHERLDRQATCCYVMHSSGTNVNTLLPGCATSWEAASAGKLWLIVSAAVVSAEWRYARGRPSAELMAEEGSTQLQRPAKHAVWQCGLFLIPSWPWLKLYSVPSLDRPLRPFTCLCLVSQGPRRNTSQPFRAPNPKICLSTRLLNANTCTSTTIAAMHFGVPHGSPIITDLWPCK